MKKLIILYMTNPFSKTILITGASRGIGKSCAIKLAEPNVTLALTSRTLEDLIEVSEICKAKGAKVFCFDFDLSNIDDIENQVKNITSQCGPIHTLINNAGIWIEKSFSSGDMKAWDIALDVNLKAVIHLTRYSLDTMPDGGAILFIGSTASKRTYANGTNYCAAKYGLLGFAGALFEDVRERGIKVCSIFPGVVNTDMHATDASFIKEKMIQPEDIADAVSFILNSPPNICPTELIIQPQKNSKKTIK